MGQTSHLLQERLKWLLTQDLAQADHTFVEKFVSEIHKFIKTRSERCFVLGDIEPGILHDDPFIASAFLNILSVLLCRPDLYSSEFHILFDKILEICMHGHGHDRIYISALEALLAVIQCDTTWFQYQFHHIRQIALSACSHANLHIRHNLAGQLVYECLSMSPDSVDILDLLRSSSTNQEMMTSILNIIQLLAYKSFPIPFKSELIRCMMEMLCAGKCPQLLLDTIRLYIPLNENNVRYAHDLILNTLCHECHQGDHIRGALYLSSLVPDSTLFPFIQRCIHTNLDCIAVVLPSFMSIPMLIDSIVHDILITRFELLPDQVCRCLISVPCSTLLSVNQSILDQLIDTAMRTFLKTSAHIEMIFAQLYVQWFNNEDMSRVLLQSKSLLDLILRLKNIHWIAPRSILRLFSTSNLCEYVSEIQPYLISRILHETDPDMLLLQLDICRRLLHSRSLVRGNDVQLLYHLFNILLQNPDYSIRSRTLTMLIDFIKSDMNRTFMIKVEPELRQWMSSLELESELEIIQLSLKLLEVLGMGFPDIFHQLGGIQVLQQFSSSDCFSVKLSAWRSLWYLKCHGIHDMCIDQDILPYIEQSSISPYQKDSIIDIDFIMQSPISETVTCCY